MYNYQPLNDKEEVTMANNIFALSNRTIGEGRFFTSLDAAVMECIQSEQSHDIDIVEMELQGNEFVPINWYESNGTLIEDDDELPTRFEGSN